MNLFKDFSNYVDWLKKWPPGDGTSLSYVYVEKTFKKSSCQKLLGRFELVLGCLIAQLEPLKNMAIYSQ